jgi:putative endonuclease
VARPARVARASAAARAAVGSAWFVYVARCADGTLYTGIARDVAARIAQHDAGRGARYTRGRGPLILLGKVRCAAQGDALRLERAIKALSRDAKLVLVTRIVRRGRAAVRTLMAGPVRPPSRA